MFHSEGGILHVEGVPITEIVDCVGTPVYITSKSILESNIRAYKEAFTDAQLLYAVKANNNLSIMKIVSSHGFGADVFSDGELYLSLLSGFRKDKILFNGNSKSRIEIEKGVECGVKFSVDSLDELRTLSEVAREYGSEIEIAFRINPDVDPKTHPKIATGLKESKFGLQHDMAVEAYRLALRLDGVQPVGIHCHIGSQILDLSPFVHALHRVMDIVAKLEREGVEFNFVDMGGGLGIDYEGRDGPTPKDLAEAILPEFEKRRAELKSDPELWLEPGRSIVGNTTILITRVNAVKKGYKNFVAVDAGFNLLIRPAMYNAFHRVAVANKMNEKEVETYTIVGPICESGDVLARDRKLPKVEAGDLIAIFDTGAYGFVMSSQYNGRPRCAEVLVSGNRWDVIRERESYSDLVGRQKIPEWLL